MRLVVTPGQRNVSRLRAFTIKDDAFVKDGEPFTVRAGSLHYFRVPQPYWRDRMRRMKALGLNTVTMYVAWNYHEEVEGQVTRLEEVTGFLDVAKAEGMLVLFRPGPYICGEWELGGLPAWLLWEDKAGIKLRTHEPTYIAAVDKWMNTLYAAVSSYNYAKGGPIALVQIENEYGSFGNCATNPDDAKYMQYLLDLAMNYFGTDVVYTTIDGGEGKTAAPLERGSPWKHNHSVLGTVDGGLSSADRYATAFQRQKDFNAPGHSPKMWSELWVGWFTVWKDAKAANKSSDNFHKGVAAMVAQDASFSLYMAHGGTNFGFWSGANGDQKSSYRPDITSYDYSSPISEAGDHNVGSDGGDLFEAVRAAIGVSGFEEPEHVKKDAYGVVDFTDEAALFGNLDALATCKARVGPNVSRLPSFEELRHNYGLMLYSYEGDFQQREFQIEAEVAHDRVQVFVGNEEVGHAYRPECPKTMNLPSGRSMSLLVENMGRINYGTGIYDYKGYLGAPPVKGVWFARCLPLNASQVQALPFGNGSVPSVGPVFRRGYLRVGIPNDTFLDMRGFSKGYVWVNGINIGRFWDSAGPQYTLYVPAPFLKKGRNEIIVLDLHHSEMRKATSVAAPRYAVANSSWLDPLLQVFV